LQTADSPWKDPLYKVQADDYAKMAAKLDDIIAAGGTVRHLVVVMQSPLQRYWSRYVVGASDELALDDTFGASRDASSFGTLMGYAPAWGMHIPVGFYILMYTQGDQGAKTAAMAWMLRHWRAMGNAPPRTIQFDADVASINAVARDAITRVLKETASMLASVAGVELVASGACATDDQRQCARVVLSALRCSDLKSAQADVAEAHAQLLSSSPYPSVPAAGALPMLAKHILEQPASQPVALGFASVLSDALIQAAKDTATLVGSLSSATVKCPRAAGVYRDALDSLVTVVRAGATTAGVSAALLRVHSAADDILKYDLRVRFSVLQSAILQPALDRIGPLLEPTDSFADWCSRLFGLHVRVCEFHVRKAWNENLAGHFCGDKPGKQAALDELREMSMCLTRGEFLRHWDAFRSKYAHKPALVASCSILGSIRRPHNLLACGKHTLVRFPTFSLTRQTQLRWVH
jgi:hypothetical protein